MLNVARVAASALEVTAAAVWVGASAGFAFLSAPLAFALVRDRDVFAELTERTLARLARLTYFAGGGAVFIALVRSRLEERSGIGGIVRGALGVAALGTIAYHQRAIVPAMTRAQAELGGTFADVAQDDPRRIAYRALHRRSTRAFGTALLCGIAQLMLAATRDAGRVAIRSDGDNRTDDGLETRLPLAAQTQPTAFSPPIG